MSSGNRQRSRGLSRGERRALNWMQEQQLAVARTELERPVGAVALEHSTDIDLRAADGASATSRAVMASTEMPEVQQHIS